MKSVDHAERCEYNSHTYGVKDTCRGEVVGSVGIRGGRMTKVCALHEAEWNGTLVDHVQFASQDWKLGSARALKEWTRKTTCTDGVTTHHLHPEWTPDDLADQLTVAPSKKAAKTNLRNQHKAQTVPAFIKRAPELHTPRRTDVQHRFTVGLLDLMPTPDDAAHDTLEDALLDAAEHQRRTGQVLAVMSWRRIGDGGWKAVRCCDAQNAEAL